MGTTRKKRIRIISGPHKSPNKVRTAFREINFHWNDVNEGQRRYVYVVEDPDIQFVADTHVKEV